MLRKGRVPILLLLLLEVAVAQDPIRTFLETGAREIDLLAPLELGSYGFRSSPFLPTPSASVQRLARSDYPTSELLPLLSDLSPRIRVLALELLFRKEDPSLLPEMVRLRSDSAPTFDRLEFYGFRDNGPPSSRRAPQTVGDFATAVADFYGVRGDFTGYWAARKNRKYWFSWLHSKLSVITGGLPTLNPGVKEKLTPFRELLNRLPPLDRDLYLIWLQSTFAEPVLADDDDLASAVKRLGRENVLAIAEGNPPGGDPELLPSWNFGQYWYTAAVVVQHATGVLQREDARRLAAVLEGEREPFKQHEVTDTVIRVSYTIAQASLLPEQASQLMHAELDRLPVGYQSSSRRGQLAAALLRLRGKEELTFSRNFFYGEPPVPAFGPEAQRALIAALGERVRPLAETLLDDVRTNSLSPGLMAFIYERFPGLRRKLLLDWFFAQKRDPHQMGNSIEYFLTIMLVRNRDHGLMKEILLDPRLDGLPVSALFDLGQKLGAYRLPRSLVASFPDLGELCRYYPFNSTYQPGEKTVHEQIQFLRAAAAYVGAE